jgi:hypothetical protein
MHLVLSLPGLLAPGAERDPEAPNLARLLASSGAPAHEPDGLDAALAARYGIARQNDWPLAPIRAAALGVDTGGAYWLAADPVTLVAERDDVHLAGAVRDLDGNEAAELVMALNAHFATDAVDFVAPTPDAWFVRAERPVALATRPLAVAAGRSLRGLLPSGSDAGLWRRWQNEIEMLLHAHPVNAARETAGKPPANGVWFSEGGTSPPFASTANGVETFADGGVARALAAHAKTPARPVPSTLDAALASAAGARTAIVALARPVELASIERVWARQAWSALARGDLETVTTMADGVEGALAWTARRPAPWRRVMHSLARPDLARALAAARERA